MSIYEPKTPSEGDAGVPSAPPHMGDDRDDAHPNAELIIPEYDEGDDAESPGTQPAAAGPAECIADFKATREKNERLALGVVLNILVFVGITASATIEWMMVDLDPDTNPFREDVNGTARLTQTSYDFYIDLYFIRYLVQCLVVSIPLDLEALAGDLRWSNIAAGEVPQLASVGVCVLFVFTEMFSLGSIRAKFGWPSILPPAILWVRLLVWKFEFARVVQQGDKHPLMRQSTLLEWVAMMRASWNVALYVSFDLFCIHDGQWDGKSVGRFGGFLLVLVQCALNVLWWMKRGRVRIASVAAPAAAAVTAAATNYLAGAQYAPPFSQYVFRGGAPEGMDRQTLVAEALLLVYSIIGLQQFLHHLFLWPDTPLNAGLVTMEGRLVPGDGGYWVNFAIKLGAMPLFLLFFRKQIFSVMKAPFRKKQRLQDGAFIAALLVEDDSDDLISQATELFRGIPFSKVSAELLRSSQGSVEEYNLSHQCKLNSIDFFVSHSKEHMRRIGNDRTDSLLRND